MSGPTSTPLSPWPGRAPASGPLTSATSHGSVMPIPPDRPGPPGTGLLAGAGFKPAYLDDLLTDTLPDAFFEVHAENYMGAGGPPHRALSALRSAFPLSVHGVGLSIGGPTPLDAAHLARFVAVVKRYEPVLVSEHLAWSSHGGTFFNDLLPLPYNRQTLHQVCAHVDQVQTALGRPLLLENPSTYLQFSTSDMSEPQFLGEVIRRTGCGLLLDVNNVVVSATNHGFDAAPYLRELPLQAVRQIHLAGHTEQQDEHGQRLLIDSHDRCVAPQVWALYADLLSLIGPVPTLIEWDSDLPAWAVLKGEMQQARALMQAQARLTAGTRRAAQECAHVA